MRRGETVEEEVALFGDFVIEYYDVRLHILKKLQSFRSVGCMEELYGRQLCQDFCNALPNLKCHLVVVDEEYLRHGKPLVARRTTIDSGANIARMY